MQFNNPMYCLALITTLATASCLAFNANATEFGYIKGAETLPKDAMELIQVITRRADKGAGDYKATDYITRLEYGATNHLTIEGVIKLQSVSTTGIQIDAYIPGDINTGLEYSGFELGAKYKFLNTAEDNIGLSTYWDFDYFTKDSHSGRDKETITFEAGLLIQQYFLEGQLVSAYNLGMEATHANRSEIQNLPDDFEWPTEPEMEIGLNVGVGLSYRFVNKWYASLEGLYEEEHETEVGKERYSFFAGPSLHYSSQSWWATLSYFKQINGGGEAFDEQDDLDLHLIEKTKHEVRLKIGLNF